MSQGTHRITVNGNVNLMTAISAGGFRGSGSLTDLVIVNKNATIVYVNLMSSAGTAPATPTDGHPIGTGETSTEFRLSNTKIPAHSVWLYSAASVNVVVTAIGGGW